MRKQVVIRIAESGLPYEASWLVLDRAEDEQPAVIKTGTLAEAATACEGVRATILVPSSLVLIADVAMPAMNQRKILSAIPFALEDQLAEDIDELHFCAGKRNAQGCVPTAVVAHQQMQTWAACFAELGVQFDVLVADVFSLPLHEGAWTLLLEDHAALLRVGPETGYSIDRDNVEFFLQLALKNAGEHAPQLIHLYDASTQSEQGFVIEGVNIEQHLLHEPAISIMADVLPKASFALNLLQGEFSRKEQLGKVWRPWIPVGALAAILIVVQFSVMLTQSISMEARSNVLLQDIQKLYLDAFPEARAQTDKGIIESETKRRLAELRGGSGSAESDFLLLLSLVGPHFAKTQGLELERMSYRAGKLDVAISIASLQTLDVLKQQLSEGKQVKVDIQSATSRNGKVAARLQVEKVGA